MLLVSRVFSPSLAALLSSLSPSSISFFLALLVSLSSFSLSRLLDIAPPFALTRFRGRRQLPQAVEVRRPRRAGVVDVVGRIRCL